MMRGFDRGVGRVLAAGAYLLVARHLPWGPRPFGHASRQVRATLGRHMLDFCGTDVNIEHGAWFGTGKGIELGDRSDIGMDALVMGPLTIGRDVMMGPRCVILSNRHDISSVDEPMNRQGFLPDLRVVIEDDVFVGAGSVILAGRRLGRGCVVGAGSVVAHDVPPWSVVAGNPARVVRKRKD